MANIKSAAKRARQAIVRRDKNQQAKKALRSLERSLRTAVAGKDKDASNKLFTEYASQLGKATQKKMFHNNTASRKIGRLAKFINKSLASS